MTDAVTELFGEDPYIPSVSEAESFYAEQMGMNGSGPPEPFSGLSHAEVLAMEFPQERMLIDDLVPIGAVGTIAGVPETYKSWQAQHIATAVATGNGGIFGKSVLHKGNVGYFWQDDSTREEAERVKLFDSIHGDGSDIPLRWHLNEGLRLPDDIPRLRITIAQNGYCLVVLDSFYNVLFGKDLKDDEAERTIALLKSEICDVTNSTVLIVDHMPWATQDNRKRLRAYGGVFKGAAVRFGIYLDAVGNKLYAEARGNNITGFKRQLAEWDGDALELRLVPKREAVDEDQYEQRIIDYLMCHPNARTADVDDAGGNRTATIRARKRLEERKIITSSHLSGTSYKGMVWNLNADAGSASSGTGIELPHAFIPVPGSTSSPLRGEQLVELVEPRETIANENPLLDE